MFFFMGTKVFVHLTHLKLPQISQTYPKIFGWSGHLIKIHLEIQLFQNQFRGILHQKRYISQFKKKCSRQKMTCSPSLQNHMVIY